MPGQRESLARFTSHRAHPIGNVRRASGLVGRFGGRRY